MELYQREDSPFWWFDATVNGRRYRRSTGETGKRAAEKSADRKIEQLRQTTRPRGASWTIGEAITTWWTEHASHLASADAIWSNIENLDRCLNCTTQIDALTSAMLLDFRARRRGELAHRSAKTEKALKKRAERPPKYVSAVTVNRDLAYLQAALRHAKLFHGQSLPDIPWADIKVSENEPRVRFASHDEYDAMQDGDDPDLADIILAAIGTGLRRANLRWQWYMVDLRGATVTIARTKGKKPTVIRLSAPVLAMLKRRRQAATGATGHIPAGDADVFDWTNFRRRWEALRKARGIVDFRWHDLRHTFGTWARKAGVDLPTLKEAMTHKDIKTTQRYAHVEPDEVASTFDKVAERMSRPTSRTKVKSSKTK